MKKITVFINILTVKYQKIYLYTYILKNIIFASSIGYFGVFFSHFQLLSYCIILLYYKLIFIFLLLLYFFYYIQTQQI